MPALPLISASMAHPLTFNVLLKGCMRSVGGDCPNTLALDLQAIERQPLQHFHQVATATYPSPCPLVRPSLLRMLLNTYLVTLATGCPCTIVISPKRRWSWGSSELLDKPQRQPSLPK